MLRSLTLKNFRCFQNLTLEPLERVNLIAGKNNVGKTSLLEAIFMFINPSNPESLFQVNRLRGIPRGGIKFEDIEELRGFFFNQDIDKVIEISDLDANNLQVSLGITRDADESTKSAFDSICGSLKNAKLPVPNYPKEIIGDSPKVSILILPEYQDSGMLEDVCLEAIKTDKAIKCIDDYFQCVYNTAQRQPKYKDISKARIRAWLSSQIEPDKSLGEAAKAGYLPWDSPAFNAMKQFLQAL
ncbi:MULTISPECIES: DUF3226 domain-containing protein [unclassified Nodularia (in: cyanobacteria)]|uniref:DUF3226 domain-containing protein n=1 Tax=unclassified Nodularia (in: cyanobacteria) TaxID=2656917 RepID=UPI001D126236|nr:MULTISPECIES: DUF3226 domain-containing protein [unclassified Nodularia (in: cyanobacteria)]